MFENYFVTAMNNLIKNKLYSAINIIGLAVGIVACILIALYVRNEISFDKHWENSDRIYRVNKTVEWTAGVKTKGGETSLLAAPALQNYFPNEIEASVRMFGGKQNFRVNNNIFEVEMFGVDSDFTNIFSLDVITGNLEASLRDSSSIALREDIAKNFYGDEDPIGKIATMEVFGLSVDYQVGAVYKMSAENSVLDIPALSLLEDEVLGDFGLLAWQSHSVASFVKLKESVNVDVITPRLSAFTDQNVNILSIGAGVDVKPSERVSYDFQPISEIYLNSPFQSYGKTGNRTMVLTFSVIAALILMIACINFIVLTTAKSTQRAQEVALRKVHGAKRYQLITQYLGESFFLVFVAMFIALALAELIIPFFEVFVGKTLSIDYSEPLTYLSLLALLILVSFAGGAYPAFILSQFRPVNSLKANRSTETTGSIAMKNIMVILQFSVSIVLIIATIIIYAQVQYSSTRDPGFNRENVVVISDLRSRNLVNERKAVLKEELSKLSNVSSATFTSLGPMQTTFNLSQFTLQQAGQIHEPILINVEQMDEDFFDVYEVPLVAGRQFIDGRDQALILDRFSFSLPEGVTDINVILNVNAISEFGFTSPEDALGAVFTFPLDAQDSSNDVSARVIGVVADFQFKSLHQLPQSVVFILSPDPANFLSLKFRGSPRLLLNEAEEVWRSVMGNEIFKTSFLEQMVAEQFDRERIEALILICFSLLAIAIACLGLFGSASFAAERRTQEIGLRKVMGAKVKNIVYLLLWQFSLPVLIANLIAWPIAVWAMMSWLERFPYQIEAWWLFPICLLAGCIALAIAWLTVVANTLKIARRNPIHALRYE